MKQQIKKWTFRLTITGMFIAVILLTIILNPSSTYANKTYYNNLTIYHNSKLDPSITTHLNNAISLIKTSEYYNGNLQLDICLNDGSIYPDIIKAIRGRAFAWGFYNKVVLQGTMNCSENIVELNGYKWNLTQLVGHEMIHCLQFDKLGLWNSNPIAKIDNWKWEGYAEYISRQNINQQDLVKNIDRLYQAEKDSWEITLEDSTITSREYYDYWILVQYCMNIRKMNYTQLLNDTTSEQSIQQEMKEWYAQEKAKEQ